MLWISKHVQSFSMERSEAVYFTAGIAALMQDNFPPAKIAGLRAMVATSQYYDPEDAATKVLPAVAPLTVEPVAEVSRLSSPASCFQRNLPLLNIQGLDMPGSQHAHQTGRGDHHVHLLLEHESPAELDMCAWTVIDDATGAQQCPLSAGGVHQGAQGGRCQAVSRVTS
jgi:hypothetical protein